MYDSDLDFAVLSLMLARRAQFTDLPVDLDDCLIIRGYVCPPTPSRVEEAKPVRQEWACSGFVRASLFPEDTAKTMHSTEPDVRAA